MGQAALRGTLIAGKNYGFGVGEGHGLWWVNLGFVGRVAAVKNPAPKHPGTVARGGPELRREKRALPLDFHDALRRPFLGVFIAVEEVVGRVQQHIGIPVVADVKGRDVFAGNVTFVYDAFGHLGHVALPCADPLGEDSNEVSVLWNKTIAAPALGRRTAGDRVRVRLGYSSPGPTNSEGKQSSQDCMDPAPPVGATR